MTTHLGPRLWAVAILAAITPTLACDPATRPVDTSAMTRVLLTDAPFPFDVVSRVDIYVVRVDASENADTTVATEWTNIVTPMQTFNLLELQRGATAIVGEGDIPAGEYAAVRLVIDTDKSSITLKDGTAADVHWQGQGEQALHAMVEEPFDVSASGGSIVIDFDVGRSFLYLSAVRDTVGNTTPARFVFLPVIRAVNQDATGTITGTVLGDADGDGTPEPVRAATVSVQRVDRLALYTGWLSSGTTDAAGTFVIDFLVPGTYRVEAQAPSESGLGFGSVGDAEVSAQAVTQVDLTLAANPTASLELSAPAGLNVGASAPLRAILLDANGDTLTNQPVTWSFGPSTVIDVTAPFGGGASTEDAVVTAIGPGLGAIVAESAGYMDSVAIVVRDPNAKPVETVELTPASGNLAVFDTLAFTVTLRDASGNQVFNRIVQWTVSDSTVIAFNHVTASVADVIAVGVGSASVTATSEGKQASATVTVHQ